jgi:thioredoxin-like negative regulator of GroEL
MTESEFFTAIEENLSVVEFCSPDCSPCKIVSPALLELRTEFDQRVKFIKIDVLEFPQIAFRLRVLGVPTVLIFNKGEPVDALYFSYPKRVYQERIQKQLEQLT